MEHPALTVFLCLTLNTVKWLNKNIAVKSKFYESKVTTMNLNTQIQDSNQNQNSNNLSNDKKRDWVTLANQFKFVFYITKTGFLFESLFESLFD